MVDLVDDNVGDTTSPSSMCSTVDVYSSGLDMADAIDGVHIVVDGTTTDSSTDFGLQTQEYDQFLKGWLNIYCFLQKGISRDQRILYSRAYNG